MPANECIPLRTPADTITVQATGACTGKRFVKISAARVGGGLTGGTSRVTTTFPGSGANVLSTDTVNAVQVVQTSSSGEAALGVCAWDLSTGNVGKVYKRGTGHILPIKSGGVVTAGQEVQTDNSGQAITLAGGIALGYALDTCGSGDDVEVLLY